MEPISRYLSTFVIPIALFGCATDSSSTTTELAAQTCPVGGTKIDHSLAVTDPVVLARFPFKRTMKQLLASAGTNAETTKQLYQGWMATFGPTDCMNPKIDPNHYGEVCPRNAEFKLASVDPTDPDSKVQFLPVGLFDRFDLAPKSGATCGEYRIVYAMSSTDPDIRGRGFYIFEAALPNPNPALGAVGCLGIAELWQGLSDPAVDSTALADVLERFYYTGGVVPNVGPVVDAKNYGLAENGGKYTAGQIRSNMFIDGVEWHLREFKTARRCAPGTTSCTLAIDHVSVKTNPANELFAGTAPLSPAFLAAFPRQVKALASSDVSTIGMTIDERFDEFESVSQRQDVLYDRFTVKPLRDAIQGELDRLGLSLQVDDILRRASTQTCAGCHQLSTGGTESQLGGGLTWPRSDILGFVQIAEDSRLSAALTDHFLPHRKDVLEGFINKHCGPSPTAVEDDGLTVGGSVVGAAN